MSTLMLSAKLDRSDCNTPWGFRMHGGKDFCAPLTIQRVTPGSLANKCGLQVGDTILRIGDFPVDHMSHKEAMQRIVGSANFLELTLQRRGGPAAPIPNGNLKTISAAPPAAPSPLATGPPAVAAPADHNRAAAPFSPGAPAAPAAATFEPYPVENTVGNLVSGTQALNIGAPAEAAPPPPSEPTSVAAAPAPAAPGPLSPVAPVAIPAAPFSPPAPSTPSSALSPRSAPPAGAVWQPRIPTGPRKMRSGTGKSMGAVGTGMKVPICEQCSVAIRGPFVLALDKTWCPDHFNCSNPHCKVPLIGIGFVEEDSQLFCEKDYEKYFAPVCNKCQAKIMRECVNALNTTFHPDCFVCSQCGVTIGSGSFHVEDGKNYCEKDWQAMFQTKCYGCQFPIEPGDRWVEALNQNWHSECFNCSTCQVNLEGQGFYCKNGKPYCKKHAGTKKF